MAKIIISLLLSFCFAYHGTDSFSQTYSPQRTHLIEIYKSQIGVREATGHNDGPQVETFLRTVGLGAGYAWCAAFIKWCLVNAGVTSAKAINAMAASTHRPGHLVYYKGKWLKQPRPGDVATIYYSSLKRIGHTLFFNGMAGNGMIYSVEGNTNSQNSREGNGVYIRIRQIGGINSISQWLDD